MDPNPVQPPPLVVWRGTAENVPRHPHSEAAPHDFGDGLYLTTQQWLGEEYARDRAKKSSARPILYRLELDRSLLGPSEKILNLHSGPVAREWETFVNTEIDPGAGKTWRQLLPPNGPNKNYWGAFGWFLDETGRKLENYNVVIGPEYVRPGDNNLQGVQYCIRNPELEAEIASRLVEWDRKPVWVRVYDGRGFPVDVNVNDPYNGEANRKYVEDRHRAASGSQGGGSSGRGGSNGTVRPPTLSPGARGLAGLLGAIEISRILLEAGAQYRNLPTPLERKLEDVRRRWEFWMEFEIRATILALVTEGSASTTADAEAADAKGRILWGIVAEDWDEAEDGELEFFLGFVDNYWSGASNENGLYNSIPDLLQLMRFLAQGRRTRAIVPAPAEAELSLSQIESWWVATRKPAHKGATTLDNAYYGLAAVVNDLRERARSVEAEKIAALQDAIGPARSRLSSHGGSFRVDKSRTLQYRNLNDRPFYSTMQQSGSVAKLGD
ncbi:MAG: hypothetical protein GY778_11110, partial [bacterium]|nr:hypothetical protein [bacterium]